MALSLKKVLLPTLIVLAAISFAGCTTSQPAAQEDKAPGQTTEKKGDTTLSGKLSKKGGKYFLEQAGKPAQEVDSYSINLTEYVDREVTITGQFSGDTLFAGKIEAK